MTEQNKYSLWIVPTGESGAKLQNLVTRLAAQYDAQDFVPHLTLISNILINSTEEYDKAIERLKTLAAAIEPFDITLTEYGFLNEEFRCLFLKAKSDQLRSVYDIACDTFPQVRDEHFQAMSHMSVLYGNFEESTKHDIITNNPLEPTTFRVDSFDLYLTNAPTESWRLDTHFPLSQ